MITNAGVAGRWSALWFVGLLVCLGCSGCLRNPGPERPSDQRDKASFALMQMWREGYLSQAKLWVANSTLRMEVVGGRSTHTLIVDYVSGSAISLLPQQAGFRRFDLSQLDQSVPHFFDPELKLDRSLVGEEQIDGCAALRYRVVAVGRGGRDYRGDLWVAKADPGFPLQWQDADRDIRVLWQIADPVDVSAEWFQIPEDYQNISDDDYRGHH